MAIRRNAQAVPDLAPRTISVLLHGWTSEEPPEVSEHEGFSGGFIDLYELGGFVRLWQAHEGFLRETARRWGWKPEIEAPDGRLMFVAEALAAGILREYP